MISVAIRGIVGCEAAVLCLVLAGTAAAVPYASGVRNTSGTTWEFILNEAADNVTITRDGGNALNLGGLAPGRHSFSMAGFNAFDIRVAKNAAAGWTEISQPGNLFAHFERPLGMVVNTDPASAYFGTVYVNNGRDLPTASGRQMGDGVYALSADLQGVDLANNFAVVANANDTTQAKAPGWAVADDANSAFRMTLDDAGNIIIGDWSDAHGGIKYASRDLVMGGPLLAQEAGPTPGVQNGAGEYIHGSIVSQPYVTGSVGNNLVLYAMDEDLESSLGEADGNNIWRWNVGAATNYDQPPSLVLDPGDLGADTDGDPYFLNLNVGVLSEIHRSEQHNKWYLLSPRNNGHDSSAVVVVGMAVSGDYNENGTVDAADFVVWRNSAGNQTSLPNDDSPGVGQDDYDRWRANFGSTNGTPTVAWSSKQFSIDHGLDGFVGEGCDVGLCGGIEDIFRGAYAIEQSGDGTKLYVVMNNLYSAPDNTNPVIGPASPNVKGHVLVIPLDANGVPDIQVDDNGTPSDMTDDFLANVQSIEIGAANGASPRVNVDVDAAGNVYVTHNISERLNVFSPGGNTLATTTSSGTFQLQTLPGLASGSAVPEPSTLLLIALATTAVLRPTRPTRTMV
jgi:hypothetical protein